MMIHYQTNTKKKLYLTKHKAIDKMKSLFYTSLTTRLIESRGERWNLIQ